MIVVSILLLLIVLLVICYLPVFVIFHDRSRHLTFAHICLYLAVGMGFLGVFGILCKFLGIDLWFSMLPGIIVTIYGFKKYPAADFVPRITLTGMKSPGPIFAISASAISFLYIFVAGILMGTGSYPSVFFNVDTPFYLGQIHALFQFNNWPPLSLSYLGGSYGYHYGSQSVCAVLSSLTGIAPHTATFLVFMPIVQLAIICAVWLIIGNLKAYNNSSFHWWFIPFLLFSNYYPIYQVMNKLNNPSFYQAIYSAMSIGKDPEIFSGHYPMLSTHFGILLALGCIFCLQNYSGKVSQILLALLVGVSIVYKSPIFVVLLFGFGLWTLYEVINKRRFSPLWPLMLSLVIAAPLYLIASPGGSSSWVFMPFQYFLGSPRGIVDTLGTFLLYALPGLLLIIILHKKGLTYGKAWLYPVAFILPTLAFVQLFGLSREGVLDGNIFQVLVILPLFVTMFTINLLKGNWHRLSKIMQLVIITVIILITLPPFVHRLAHTGILLFIPERGHEYTENHMLAEALTNIPVLGSVIVTNDFRYPAQNYARDLRQLQYPALFGHQMYASNFVYERFDDTDRRLALQWHLRNDEWDPDMVIVTQEEGWTHLVIHRASPHAGSIPLQLIFENSEYQVYKFR